MKFLNLSFVIVLSGFALQMQQVQSNNDMIDYIQSDFPWMKTASPYFRRTDFLDPKLDKEVALSESFGKYASDQSNFLYEKKLSGTQDSMPSLQILRAW